MDLGSGADIRLTPINQVEADGAAQAGRESGHDSPLGDASPVDDGEHAGQELDEAGVGKVQEPQEQGGEEDGQDIVHQR